MDSFGFLLRQTRKFAGLTQEQLAEKSGIDDTYISKIETGTYPPPSREIVLKFADALEITDKAKRASLLLKAGCASEEDLEALAELLRATNRGTSGTEQASEEESINSEVSLRTAYNTILPISYRDILLHQIAVLEKKLEVATKNQQEITKGLQELRAIAEQLYP